MTARPRTGPLSHIRVLDLSRLYPGAFTTSLLADLGANVIKVEAPGFGDGLRVMSPEPFKAGHIALNRGKRSLSLDLKAEGSVEVLRQLIYSVDVVVESHRPGAFDAMGLGYETFLLDRPGLVWCSLTGFGSTSPYATVPGHDLTYTAYSGVLDLLSEPHEPPPVPQTTVALQAGALMAVVGITSALTQKEYTGHGAFIDASLVDAAMWMVAEDVARAASAPAPGWPAMAARGVYRCADDRWVTVTASEPRSWAALCDALDVAELASLRFGEDDAKAMARLREVFATKPASAWLASPGFVGGVGPVNTPADLLDDPHVQAMGALHTIDGTDTRVLGNPLRIRGADGATTTVTSPPPEIGEHTDEVLREFGFNEETIARLHAQRIV